jgi:hypothetical protein
MHPGPLEGPCIQEALKQPDKHKQQHSEADIRGVAVEQKPLLLEARVFAIFLGKLIS